MLTNIHIENFKCFAKADIELRPLTILTGTNSSGKSSVLQAILVMTASITPQKKLEQEVKERFFEIQKIAGKFNHANFNEIINKYSNSEIAIIDLSHNRSSARIAIKNNTSTTSSLDYDYFYEDSIFYLSANRIGLERFSILNPFLKIGNNGQYAIGTFERLKDESIHSALVFDDNSISYTLKHQVAFWLSRITGTEIEVQTEKVTSDTVKSFFIDPELGELSPDQVGTGNSYLLKILIMCLTAKPDDLLLIENPEIHLHPKAQSHLGEFLAFIASRGVQLIIETHCEHLINRVRYEVYDDKLSSEDVVIHYKPSAREDFQKILINQNGHYINDGKEEIDFPEGYFDATLDQLLSIG